MFAEHLEAFHETPVSTKFGKRKSRFYEAEKINAEKVTLENSVSEFRKTR